MQEAISKIRAEMDKEKISYVQVVGQFLLQHLEQNPHDAEKIFAPDKTILKSIDAMKKVAEKKKIGNVAVLTPQEGFEEVLKYFKIVASPAIPVLPVVTMVSTSKPACTSTDFDVSLEDFL